MHHGDAGRSTFPALPEFGEAGQHHIAQDGRDGQVGEHPVQNGLRGRLVEGVQGLPERGRVPTSHMHGSGRTGTGDGTGAAIKRGAPASAAGSPSAR